MAKGIVTGTPGISAPRPISGVTVRPNRGRGAAGPHGRLPITTTRITPSPVVKPIPTNAEWWRNQFKSSPEFLLTDPTLRAEQNRIGQATGFVIGRNAAGQTLYKTATGGKDITQGFDDKGNVVYRDPSGKTYAPGELQMDIRMLDPGQAGYLSGAIGQTQAQSNVNQQNIGEAAARAGVRRSGMRAESAIEESSNAQKAIQNIIGTGMSGLAGVDKQYAEMFGRIYNTLTPKAGDLANVGSPVPTPRPNPIPAETARVVSFGKQRLVLKPGVSPSKDEFKGISRVMLKAIRDAGGADKLKSGKGVGKVVVGGKNYRLVFANGRFVLKAMR